MYLTKCITTIIVQIIISDFIGFKGVKRVRVVGSAGVYSPNGSWGELSCALDMDSGDKETEPQCHSQSADAPLSCACSGTSCGIVYIETDNSHLKIIQFNFNNLHSCTNLVKLKQYTIW